MRGKMSAAVKYQSMAEVRRGVMTEIQKNPKTFKNKEEKAAFRVAFIDEHLANHAYYRDSLIKRLGPSLLQWCRDWLTKPEHLDYTGGEIDYHARRIFMTDPEAVERFDRKALGLMCEVLEVVGTCVHYDEEGWTKDFTDEEYQEYLKSNS